MPGLLMRISERNWLQAHRSTYSFRLGGLKLNSSHNTVLAPSEPVTFSRLSSAMSGSGVSATARSRRRRDAGEEVPAAPRRQERHLLGQLHEVGVRRHHVAERIPSQHGADRFRIGIGVEQQVGFRLGAVARAGEGLVQQVVENVPGRLGLVAVIVEEGGRGSSGGGATADGGAGGLVVGPRRLRPAALAQCRGKPMLRCSSVRWP